VGNSNPRTPEERMHIGEAMRRSHIYKTPQDVTCPVCGKDSWYVARDDILTHKDGSQNVDCWDAIDRQREELAMVGG
jgi:hypothetical protein